MSKLLEVEKKCFVGNEFYGSILGVVGLGVIGLMVVEMVLVLGMKVVGYDFVLLVDVVWCLLNCVEWMENFYFLLFCVDYIMLYVFVLDVIKDMINYDIL